MFIGHFAVGLASKRLAPRASLGWLILAPLFLDVLWPVFVLLGWERVRIAPGDTAFTPLAFDSYPWSHSLLMTMAWAALLGGAAAIATRDRRASLVVAAGVASHWLLDALSHRPDLPLAPGVDAKLGLGLWNSVGATILVEISMFAAGLWLYVRATRAVDRIGRWALVAFAALLVILYAGNIAGPPPPSVGVLAGSALGLLMFVPWAAWLDRHRAPR